MKGNGEKKNRQCEAKCCRRQIGKLLHCHQEFSWNISRWQYKANTKWKTGKNNETDYFHKELGIYSVVWLTLKDKRNPVSRILNTYATIGRRKSLSIHHVHNERVEADFQMRWREEGNGSLVVDSLFRSINFLYLNLYPPTLISKV